jgi:hypothetical protein
MRVTCPAHLILRFALIIFGQEQNDEALIMQFSHPPVASLSFYSWVALRPCQ